MLKGGMLVSWLYYIIFDHKLHNLLFFFNYCLSIEGKLLIKRKQILLKGKLTNQFQKWLWKRVNQQLMIGMLQERKSQLLHRGWRQHEGNNGLLSLVLSIIFSDTKF